MLISDTAIVLGIVPYNDHSRIVKLITSQDGLIVSLLKQNSKRKTIGLFTPLNIIQIHYFKKTNQNFCTIKESILLNQSTHTPQNEILKINLKIFLSEVLLGIIKDRNVDTALFNFILNKVTKLNKTENSVANFHLEFLCGIIKVLGVSPTNTYSAQTPYFNIETGYFEKSENIFFPINANVSTELSKLFFVEPEKDFSEVKLSGVLRKELLQILIKYLDIHLHGLGNIKSLAVLEEIFA